MLSKEKGKGIEPRSFADGIRMINEKGALVVPTRLTKKRAVILLDMVGRFREEWNMTHKEGHHAEDDMQHAVQWLCNQIFKRWSQNELYSAIDKTLLP